MTINLFAPCTNRLGYEARLFIRFGDEWIKTTPQDNGTLVTAEVPALTETFECAVVVAQPGAAIHKQFKAIDSCMHIVEIKDGKVVLPTK